jgi:hypothetical protein
MIVGVDFATDSGKKTWIARGKRDKNELVIDLLASVAHKDILGLAKGASVIGIDVPFGWPIRFKDALQRYRADNPVTLQAPFPERLTDINIRNKLNLTPLSVAAQLIGRCTWEAARLLAEAKSADYCINPTELTKKRSVIEVYPKATLCSLSRMAKADFNNLQHYKKGARAPANRGEICELVLRRLSIKFEDPNKACQDMQTHHDALDAALALVTADAFSRGEVLPPLQNADQAAQEGWIYYPADAYAKWLAN